MLEKALCLAKQCHLSKRKKASEDGYRESIFIKNPEKEKKATIRTSLVIYFVCREYFNFR